MRPIQVSAGDVRGRRLLRTGVALLFGAGFGLSFFLYPSDPIVGKQPAVPTWALVDLVASSGAIAVAIGCFIARRIVRHDDRDTARHSHS